MNLDKKIEEFLQELTIPKLKSKIEEYENKREFVLKEMKNIKIINPFLKSKQFKEITVNASPKRENIFEKYVIQNEEYKLYQKIIDYIDSQIKICDELIEKELIRINEFGEWEQKVINMREEGKQWLIIACNTPFSMSTCKRIYKRYKNKRNI